MLNINEPLLRHFDENTNVLWICIENYFMNIVLSNESGDVAECLIKYKTCDENNKVIWTTVFHKFRTSMDKISVDKKIHKHLKEHNK